MNPILDYNVTVEPGGQGGDKSNLGSLIPSVLMEVKPFSLKRGSKRLFRVFISFMQEVVF